MDGPAGRLLVTCMLLVAGCSSGTGGGTFTNSNPNLILREDILAMTDGSALDVVQRYRSSWLRPRSQGSIAGARRDPRSGTVRVTPEMPVVFVDEVRVGRVQSLGQVSTATIESIVFINALDATTRYGTGYAGGIIRVNTIGAR